MGAARGVSVRARRAGVRPLPLSLIAKVPAEEILGRFDTTCRVALRRTRGEGLTLLRPHWLFGFQKRTTKTEDRRLTQSQPLLVITRTRDSEIRFPGTRA